MTQISVGSAPSATTNSLEYDIIVVGGGVGGSAFGKAMAERGQRVLIIEREHQFRDRVRGELLFPWSVAEAQELGVYDTLTQARGHHPTYWAEYAGPDPLPPRDFAQDTPQQLRALCIYHPHMQEALLDAAKTAGAEVRRAARIRQVQPGREPQVLLEGGDGQATVTTRLVVGADGRSSMMRKWGDSNHTTTFPTTFLPACWWKMSPLPPRAVSV